MNTESERSEQVARSPRRPFSTSSGALLAATPIPFAVTAWAHGGVDLGTPIWALVLLTASTISLAVAGLTISTHARPGRVLATLGTIAPVVLATARAIARVLGREPRLIASPGTYDQKHIVRTGRLDQCIAYGPGILELAHQPDEYVEVDDLLHAAQVMAVAAWELTGSAAGAG